MATESVIDAINPVTDDRWEGLSPLAQNMIWYIVHSDASWLERFVEGEIVFQIGNRGVVGMTPSPMLRPGHGLPRAEG